MKIITFLLLFTICLIIFYLYNRPTSINPVTQINDTLNDNGSSFGNDTVVLGKSYVDHEKDPISSIEIITKNVNLDSLVSFAESLLGTPYKYASTDPLKGFDCSGFITYVFNHYKIKVPRSSKDFENVGIEIPVTKSKKGDLILFTGTDSTERVIGHMGIILSNNNGIKFIHATSGKAHSVVITDFNNYYKGRFVKIIRVFN